MRRQSARPQCPQLRHRFGRRPRAEHGAIDQRPPIAIELEHDAGERRDGSTGAEQADAAVARFVGDAMDPFEAEKPCLDVVDHRLKAGRGEPGAAIALGKADDADRQAVVADQFGRAAAEPHPRQFGRSTADVEQQGAPPTAFQQRRATLQGEFGLLTRRDEIEAQPGLFQRARQELTPVDRLPACFGCDRTHASHRPPLQPRRDRRECGERPVHGGGAEAAMCVQAFAEPHRPAEAIDDTKFGTAGAGCGDAYQKPTIVRAEIDRCEPAATLGMTATLLRPVALLNGDACHILALPPQVCANGRLTSSLFSPRAS